MFIVLLDEPGLFVYESPDAAARSIEPPDAEAEVRAAFDDSGVPYRVRTLLEEHCDYTNPPEAKAKLESLLQLLKSSLAGLKPEA